MDSTRELASYYARGRVAIGVVLMLFPGSVMRLLLGEDASPTVKMLSRLVGARDLIIGAGTLAALDGQGDARLGPWMSYGAAADASDALAMILAYRHLPPRKRFASVMLAIGGAASGGYLMASIDD